MLQDAHHHSYHPWEALSSAAAAAAATAAVFSAPSASVLLLSPFANGKSREFYLHNDVTSASYN